MKVINMALWNCQGKNRSKEKYFRSPKKASLLFKSFGKKNEKFTVPAEKKGHR